MAESADATDLKSVVGNNVRVRPPLAPHMQGKACTEYPTGLCYGTGFMLSQPQQTFKLD